MWYWHKEKHRDQQSRIENTRINLHIEYEMIFNKVPRLLNRERTVTSKNGAKKLDIHMQKSEVALLSYTTYKNEFIMD